MRRALPLLITGALSCALGCASGSPPKVPDPVQTAAALARAIEADQAGAAYTLLSPALRRQVSAERFAQLWQQNRAELHELSAELTRTAQTERAQAYAELDDGERVSLRLEGGQWRIEGGVLDAQALGSPKDAVVELRRALQRQSLPALLRVLSQERRASFIAAFERSMQDTADPLALRVEVHGDDAIVHLQSGGEIHLKREAGRWQVWDVR